MANVDEALLISPWAAGSLVQATVAAVSPAAGRTQACGVYTLVDRVPMRSECNLVAGTRPRHESRSYAPYCSSLTCSIQSTVLP